MKGTSAIFKAFFLVGIIVFLAFYSTGSTGSTGGYINEPPVAEADFIPDDAEDDESSEDEKGLFEIVATATDPNDNLESVVAVIELPGLDDLDIKLKVKDKIMIQIDLEKGKAEIMGPDPETLLAEILEYGGFLVENGQHIKAKLKDDLKYKLKLKDDGTLDIKAPEVILTVTATDSEGASDTVSASPFETLIENMFAANAIIRLQKVLESSPVELFLKKGVDKALAEERRIEVISISREIEKDYSAGDFIAVKEKTNTLIEYLNPFSNNGWINPLNCMAIRVFPIAINVMDIFQPVSSGGVKNGLYYFFEEDFEGDISGWTYTGPWHRVSNSNLSLIPSFLDDDGTRKTDAGISPSQYAFWYGYDATGDYDNGATNTGELISPSFYVPSVGQAIVAFDTWEQTEDYFTAWDTKSVFYSLDDGATWNLLDPIYQGQRRTWGATRYKGQNNWVTMITDLQGNSGQNVRLKFVFDTVDNMFNKFRGWMVDNVQVYATRAELDWTPVASNIDSQISPVLVGDEKYGRLYAFTIDNSGIPYLYAHNMYTGFSISIPVSTPEPLVPGSAAATSYSGLEYGGSTHGNVLLAARGQTGRLYSTLFYTTRTTMPYVPSFQLVSNTTFVGRPAIAADGSGFHIVAVEDVEQGTPARLLHSETCSYGGGWQSFSEIPNAISGPYDPAVTVSPPKDNIWGDRALHVAWVDPTTIVHHNVKPKDAPFGSEVNTNVFFAISNPSITYFNSRVHLAIQIPGTLIYSHSNEDGSWGAVPGENNLSSIPHDSTGAPSIVEFFGNMIIFTTSNTGIVEFFRVDNNLPGEPIAHWGNLEGVGQYPLYPSSAPIQAIRSMGEVFVSANQLAGGVGDYIWASRSLAAQTFEELGLEFNNNPICGSPGTPLHQPPVYQNVTAECPDERLLYPPPINSDISNHVTYSRLAALIWTFPWSMLETTGVVDPMKARVRGQGPIGKASGSTNINNRWFMLGYLDLGGSLNTNLGPPVKPKASRNGVVDQEFTHPFWPIPGAGFSTTVFDDLPSMSWDNLSAKQKLAYASSYAIGSFDHNFIETWRRYRLGNADNLRQRVQDGLSQGVTALRDKYDYIRFVLYDGQEFQKGKRIVSSP